MCVCVIMCVVCYFILAKFTTLYAIFFHKLQAIGNKPCPSKFCTRTILEEKSDVHPDRRAQRLVLALNQRPLCSLFLQHYTLGHHPMKLPMSEQQFDLQTTKLPWVQN
eukprot:m.131056 g.131056  ORF g.131056 m.131056 type:complete len:108 (+) comp14612_c0_seq36:196-519(+)